MMYGDEKSDPFIVAGKPANGDGRPEPERVERREGAEENTRQTSTRRTPSRASVSPGLDRVRTAARLNRKERFTALLHHVDAGLLRSAYSWLKRDAAPGVDGMTWPEYGEDLEPKLADLHARIHRGEFAHAHHVNVDSAPVSMGVVACRQACPLLLDQCDASASYGINNSAVFRQAGGIYAGRVLRGEKPA